MSYKVAIWLGDALPPSQTFISNQVSSLSRHTAVVFAKRRTDESDLPLPEVVTPEWKIPFAAPLADTLYNITRYSGSFHKELEQRSPDLIHAHFGENGTIALPYSQRHSIPLITTFHGGDASVKKATVSLKMKANWYLYQRRLPNLMRHGRLFLAVSEAVRQKLISAGFDSERTFVHYIGVDTEQFAYRDPAGHIPSGRILQVARLTEKKGLREAVRAFSVVHQRLPGSRFDIVGDGPLRDELRDLVISLGLEHAITLHGAKTPSEVQRLLSEADLFCLPSVTAPNGDEEGLPISILEAMSTGIPVVSTYHSGIPEAVTDAETGLLVAERDVAALAAAMEAVLSRPDLSARLVHAARARVERNFSLTAQTGKLEQLYDLAVEVRR